MDLLAETNGGHLPKCNSIRSRRPAITERALRPITAIEGRGEQLREFQRYLSRNPANSHTRVTPYIRGRRWRWQEPTHRHHEGDGAYRHKDNDDLRLPRKIPHPRPGRETQRDPVTAVVGSKNESPTSTGLYELRKIVCARSISSIVSAHIGRSETITAYDLTSRPAPPVPSSPAPSA